MKSYKNKVLLFITILFMHHQTIHPILKKSIDVTFEMIDSSIRNNLLEKTNMYVRTTFLSITECCNLIKIIAVEGDSEEHLNLIKKIYEHAGTIFIKKSENKKKETPLSLIAELLKIESSSKELHDYYTSINLLLSIAQTLETKFENNLSKKTRNSLRKSLNKNNF